MHQAMLGCTLMWRAPAVSRRASALGFAAIKTSMYGINMSAITASQASLSPTLVSRAISPPVSADAAVRAALERAYRLPSYTPPPNPSGLAGNVARAAGFIGAFLAARYLTSEGELNLAKDTGQIPGYITSNDMRSASSAFTGAGFDGTRAQDLSPTKRAV
jgi:hypothetical protein